MEGNGIASTVHGSGAAALHRKQFSHCDVLDPEDIGTAEGVAQALAAILASAAQGEITIGEAVQFASLLEIRRKTMETQEFERRLGKMENRINLGESE